MSIETLNINLTIKQKTIFCKKIVCLILISQLSFLSSFAQRFTATVESNQIPLNYSFDVTYTVENNIVKDFTAPEFDGFEVYGSAQSTNLTIKNGKTSKTVSYIYTLKPKKQGDFNIRAAKIVNSDGQFFFSNTLSIHVVDSIPNYLLIASVDTNTIALNQVLKLNFQIKTNSRFLYDNDTKHIVENKLDTLVSFAFNEYFYVMASSVTKYTIKEKIETYEVEYYLIPKKIGSLITPKINLSIEELEFTSNQIPIKILDADYHIKIEKEENPILQKQIEETILNDTADINNYLSDKIMFEPYTYSIYKDSIKISFLLYYTRNIISINGKNFPYSSNLFLPSDVKEYHFDDTRIDIDENYYFGREIFYNILKPKKESTINVESLKLSCKVLFNTPTLPDILNTTNNKIFVYDYNIESKPFTINTNEKK